MKKVMICQPMAGKTAEQIRSEREEVVTALESEGYEVIDTIFTNFTGEGNIPLKHLAKSLENMADVDYVYFMDGWRNARGCRIEYQACIDYGIQIIILDDDDGKVIEIEW